MPIIFTISIICSIIMCTFATDRNLWLEQRTKFNIYNDKWANIIWWLANGIGGVAWSESCEMHWCHSMCKRLLWRRRLLLNLIYTQQGGCLLQCYSLKFISDQNANYHFVLHCLRSFSRCALVIRWYSRRRIWTIIWKMRWKNAGHRKSMQ